MWGCAYVFVTTCMAITVSLSLSPGARRLFAGLTRAVTLEAGPRSPSARGRHREGKTLAQSYPAPRRQDWGWNPQWGGAAVKAKTDATHTTQVERLSHTLLFLE